MAHPRGVRAAAGLGQNGQRAIAHGFGPLDGGYKLFFRETLLDRGRRVGVVLEEGRVNGLDRLLVSFLDDVYVFQNQSALSAYFPGRGPGVIAKQYTRPAKPEGMVNCL